MSAGLSATIDINDIWDPPVSASDFPPFVLGLRPVKTREIIIWRPQVGLCPLAHFFGFAPRVAGSVINISNCLALSFLAV